MKHEILNKLKRRGTSFAQSSKTKKSGSEVAFESKVERFKNFPKLLYMLTLGPGKYDTVGQFENKVMDKKSNLLYSKTERFGFSKLQKKLPGPGAYKGWNKKPIIF